MGYIIEKSLDCPEKKVGRNMDVTDGSVKDQKEVRRAAEEASIVLEMTHTTRYRTLPEI